MQQQPYGGYHPIGYISRANAQAEKNDFVAEIEALGLERVVTHLRAFVEGTKFLVRCEQRALMSVLTTNSPNKRIN